MLTPPVNFGLLGTSRIARSAHLPQATGLVAARIVSIAGRDPAKAARLAGEFSLPHFHSETESLLADPAIAAVIITLPNALHVEWAIRAAMAGKHVLCEKPLALDRASLTRLFAVADRHGVQVREGFMYRENPKHAWVGELLARGCIGQLRHVHAELTYPLADWTSDARVVASLGGGSLFDAGCYAVDAIGHLFGRLPVRVSAHQVIRPDQGVDETFHGILEYPDGATATITSSLGAAFTDRYQLIGTNGRIDVPLAFPSSQREAAVTVFSNGRTEERVFPAVRLHAAQLERFATSLLQGAPCPVNREAAVRNATTLEFLKRAAVENRPLDLPAVFDSSS